MLRSSLRGSNCRPVLWSYNHSFWTRNPTRLETKYWSSNNGCCRDTDYRRRYLRAESEKTLTTLFKCRDKFLHHNFHRLFYALTENKYELLNIIKEIKPDVIHFQEFPEYFMDSGITKEIYDVERDYVIVETSHDSSFSHKNKVWFPDRLALISQRNPRTLPSK